MENVRGLAKRVAPNRSNRRSIVTRHQGVVTAVTSPTVTVRIDGATTTIPNVKRLASYTPSVNDTVEVLIDDTDIIILGKLA